MAELMKAGQRVADVLSRIRGAEGVNLERLTGLPFLTIQPDHEAISRYGLSVSDVQQVIETAIGGKTVGQFFQGDRRFPIVVRLSERLRANINALNGLPVGLPGSEGRSTERA